MWRWNENRKRPWRWTWIDGGGIIAGWRKARARWLSGRYCASPTLFLARRGGHRGLPRGFSTYACRCRLTHVVLRLGGAAPGKGLMRACLSQRLNSFLLVTSLILAFVTSFCQFSFFCCLCLFVYLCDFVYNCELVFIDFHVIFTFENLRNRIRKKLNKIRM